jgi:hypothetical protein
MPTPQHARTQHATSAAAFASAAVRASDLPDSNRKNAHLATCAGKFDARQRVIQFLPTSQLAVAAAREADAELFLRALVKFVYTG